MGKGKGGKKGKGGNSNFAGGKGAEDAKPADDMQASKADDETQVIVKITKADVKALLGPKGRIRKMRQDSNVSNFKIVDADEPYVVIKGKEENVRTAKDMLMKACSIEDAPPAFADASSREPEAETTPVPSEGEKGETSALTGVCVTTTVTSMMKKAISNPYFTKYYAPIAGAAVGVPTGTVIGAIVGLPAALFTFGLSVPVCGTVGAVVGGAGGAFGGRKVALGMENYVKFFEG
jgi:hypothetical protein